MSASLLLAIPAGWLIGWNSAGLASGAGSRDFPGLAVGVALATAALVLLIVGA